MATPDRTEELVRAMLERRADTPIPTWLADRTMHAVAASRQERPGLLDRLALPNGTPARVALVAAVALLLVALVGSALAVGGLLDEILDPGPGLPAVVVPGDGSPSSGSPASDGMASAEPSAPASVAVPTPRPVPDTLVADTIAVVTKTGDGLRVRSAPGVGADSEKLEPLLPARTRMFVVGGPTPADGYDWYEVQTDSQESDIDLYGWVAAAGKDGDPWIRPSAPKCPDTLDGEAIAGTSRLDLLACYGDAPYEVEARALFLVTDVGDDPCPWSPGPGVCSIEPSWMGEQAELFVGEFETGPGETGGVLTAPVVIPPEMLAAARDAEDAEDVRVTLSADSPLARDCRFLDKSGNEVAPRARAILECRMRPVVQALAWDAVDQPSDGLPTDSMATVSADMVDVWSAPDPEGDATVLYTVPAGTLVYIDAAVSGDDGEWVGIVPEDPAIGRYGWVREDDAGDPVLEPASLDCPREGDWAAFNRLSPVLRLACSDGEPVTVDVVIDAVPEPQPTSAFACMAFPYIAGRPPCQATPAWLASPTGVDVTGPGDITFPALDPELLSQSALPSTPTVMRVTGRYEHPAADDCRVTNPTTGEDLMVPAEAAVYCRARFVIERIESLN